MSSNSAAGQDPPCQGDDSASRSADGSHGDYCPSSTKKFASSASKQGAFQTTTHIQKMANFASYSITIHPTSCACQKSTSRGNMYEQTKDWGNAYRTALAHLIHNVPGSGPILPFNLHDNMAVAPSSLSTQQWEEWWDLAPTLLVWAAGAGSGYEVKPTPTYA